MPSGSFHPDVDRCLGALHERVLGDRGAIELMSDPRLRDLVLHWFCAGWAARDGEVRMLKEELGDKSRPM